MNLSANLWSVYGQLRREVFCMMVKFKIKRSDLGATPRRYKGGKIGKSQFFDLRHQSMLFQSIVPNKLIFIV
jgi:hypothetical protein